MKIEKIEDHCEHRLRQRGRNTRDLHIISKYGERCKSSILLSERCVKKHCKRLKRWVVRHQSSIFKNRIRAVRALICDMEGLTNWMTVVSPNGEVITVYPAGKSRQRQFMRGKVRPAR